MIWPTLPAFAAANFVDHFSVLDTARWGSVTSGTGAVTVTDSYVDCNAPANSAAFIYLKAQLDKSKSQLILACINRASTGAQSGNAGLWVVNGAAAPAADTAANIDAKAIIERDWSAQTSLAIFDSYWSNTNAQTVWDGPNSAWTTTYASTINSMMPIQNDDYYILGLEIDGVNQRWRLLGWGQSFATAGTWTFNQGWRLFSLSNWVTWANTRSSANLWLCLGQMYTNDASAHEFKVEWVNYAEAPAGNTVVDGWVASKQNLAAAHRVRHVYSYDGKTFVPQDRTTWALDLGAGSPDNAEINEPYVVYDGATTDYLFYTGTTGTTKSICVASATHVAAGTGQTAAFTRFGSNPILTLGSAGAFDDKQIGFVCVVKDDAEPDPNKRWKMLYAGQKVSDNKHRMGYATAPSPTGTWTKQGMVLDVGGAGANDEGDVFGMTIVRYGGQWEVWYEGHDAVQVGHLMRATGTDLGALTKDGTTYYTAPISAANQVLTAALNTTPGRTVTVGSTAGFSVDAMVILDQDTNNDQYSTTRIRKILSGTQIENYHSLTGFTTSARIKQIDSSPNFSPRLIVKSGSEWWLYNNLWEPFGNSAEGASFAALLEEAHLFTHTATAPAGATFAVQYLTSPVTSRGFNNDQESFENLTLLNLPVPSAAPPISRRSDAHLLAR